jgi:hypothetical protein
MVDKKGSNAFLPEALESAIKAISRTDGKAEDERTLLFNVVTSMGETGAYLLNPRFDKNGVQQNAESTCPSQAVYESILMAIARGRGGNYLVMYKMGATPSKADRKKLKFAVARGNTAESRKQLTDKNQKYIWQQATSICTKYARQLQKIERDNAIDAAAAEFAPIQEKYEADVKAAELNELPLPEQPDVPEILQEVEKDIDKKAQTAVTDTITRLGVVLENVSKPDDLHGCKETTITEMKGLQAALIVLAKDLLA